MFIAVYQYILFKDKDVASQTAYVLVKSVVASFVIKTIYDFFITLIPDYITIHNNLGYVICLFMVAVAMGYLCAMILPSDAFISIRKRTHIFRTIHSNIWDDVNTPGVWVRVWRRNSDRSYLGQIKYIEDYSYEPIIVLEYYQYLDEDGTPLVDYSKNKNRSVMLNLREFERVEIIDHDDCERRDVADEQTC